MTLQRVVGRIGVILGLATGPVIASFPTTAPGAPHRNDLMEAVEQHLEKCDRMFKRVETKVSQAETRFAGYYRVPGFPYLRTNRLMGSYVGELDHRAKVGAWLYQLRDNDGFSRRIELVNLGMSLAERSELLNDLRLCAVWQSLRAYGNPETRGQLLHAAQPPSWAQTDLQKPDAPDATAGGGPLSALTAKLLGVLGLNAPSTTSAIHWTPRNEGEPLTATQVREYLRTAPRDALGRIGMTTTWWRKLARYYAPNLLIETASDYDLPATPTMTDKGPGLDRGRVVLYYKPGFARVSGHVLLQFNYFVWFASLEETPRDTPALDGLIWRVTVGQNGRPIAYESLRMDGSDHRWFTVNNLRPSTRAQPRIQHHVDATTLPKTVHVAAASHDITRLRPTAGVTPKKVRNYSIERYESLFTLETETGDTASLFDPDGIVRGSRKGSNDVRPRQYGSHPLPRNEPWFFDNPNLLEKVFELPSRLARTSPAP